LRATWVINQPASAAAVTLPDGAFAGATTKKAQEKRSKNPELAGEEGEEPGDAHPGEEISIDQLRSVFLRLESAVPGCQVTVDLNGSEAAFRQDANTQRNQSMFKKGVKPSISEKKRYSIEPLQQPFAASTGTSSGSTAKPEVLPTAKGVPKSAGPPAPESEHAAADGSPEPDGNSGDPEASSAAGSASFVAKVTLDTVELQAKTTQELLEPTIEVVEVFDTSVVLKICSLTGDKFELTVYASGRDASQQTQASRAMVQKGPVRSSESVHRISDLDCSQVYVAWVRVICEGKVKESTQKGFKTLLARVKTIWEEPDHIILGIPEGASVKEITKAFRQKSLQCHPDKESDPEKKEAAEDMMKRVNLAKTNMMRCAPRDDPSTAGADSTSLNPSPTAGSEPPTTPAGPEGDVLAPGGRGGPSDPRSGGYAYPDFSDSDFSMDSDDLYGMGLSQGPRPGDRIPDPERDAEAAREKATSLEASLRVEAAKAPKLKVITRGLTSLDVEASGLSIGCRVEVQWNKSGEWQAATEAVEAKCETMRFTLPNLEENQQYRLRLRQVVEVEPFRLLFAKFAAEPAEPEEPDDDEDDDEDDPEEADSENQDPEWTGQSDAAGAGGVHEDEEEDDVVASAEGEEEEFGEDDHDAPENIAQASGSEDDHDAPENVARPSANEEEEDQEVPEERVTDNHGGILQDYEFEERWSL